MDKSPIGCGATRGSPCSTAPISGWSRRGSLPYAPDLVVIDVSFISLRLVLPPVLELSAPAVEILALIKPQFEVGKG